MTTTTNDVKMSSLESQREQKNASYIITFARDLLTVASLGVLLLCIHDLASPFFRGFQCDDDSIRYPYKDSTVPSSVCYLCGSGLNIALILVIEYIALQEETNNSNSNAEFQGKLYLKNVYCRLIIWLFGAISSELLTDISKFTAGRLRPHFIDVCKPVIRTDNGDVKMEKYCLDFSNRHEYITNYYCSGSPSSQRDARLSFMSGHSSYSAYSAAFAVFYLQSTLDISKFGLIKPALQVLIISTAFYTGLTRVSDYKHHWHDVLAGLLQGSSVATVVSVYLWPAFYKTYTKCFRSASPRIRDSQTGEELNRISY